MHDARWGGGGIAQLIQMSYKRFLKLHNRSFTNQFTTDLKSAYISADTGVLLIFIMRVATSPCMVQHLSLQLII